MTERESSNDPVQAAASSRKERILVVEDELAMRTVLQDYLGAKGYRVITAGDGEKGLQRAIQEKPDLIILDIMMPKLDGFTLCAELRRLSMTMPVLMLTAKGQIQDRVRGLETGADDYLVKPFSTEELLARVKALLRRIRRVEKTVREIRVGGVCIDFVRQQAVRGQEPIYLSSTEYALLRVMAEADGAPVTRDRFLEIVWGYAAFPTTRTVDVHIAHLRAKLEPNPERPQWIKTAHGAGYYLDLKRNEDKEKIC